MAPGFAVVEVTTEPAVTFTASVAASLPRVYEKKLVPVPPGLCRAFTESASCLANAFSVVR